LWKVFSIKELEMPQKKSLDRECREYMREHYKTFMENRDNRPYWQWVAVEDMRMCEACKFLNKKVFLYSDPIWQMMIKRLHKGCRCGFRAFTESDLRERDLDISNSLDDVFKEVLRGFKGVFQAS